MKVLQEPAKDGRTGSGKAKRSLACRWWIRHNTHIPPSMHTCAQTHTHTHITAFKNKQSLMEEAFFWWPTTMEMGGRRMCHTLFNTLNIKQAEYSSCYDTSMEYWEPNKLINHKSRNKDIIQNNKCKETWSN
jgi:hypothetical protein